LTATAHAVMPCGIRPAQPGDRTAILAMHDRCSEESRNGRWLGHVPRIPDRYLAAVLAGSADHLALVATVAIDVVGLASASATSDGKREIGLLVEDSHQGAGIGTLLLETLMEHVGATEDLCADIRFQNRRLLAKLARYGTVAASYQCGVCHACVTRPLGPHLRAM
jgi:GNAT superfamily N-acetyltransferase